jgi:hypothetical protein
MASRLRIYPTVWRCSVGVPRQRWWRVIRRVSCEGKRRSVPASTMSPRTRMISAVSEGFPRTTNAVVSNGAITTCDHNPRHQS